MKKKPLFAFLLAAAMTITVPASAFAAGDSALPALRSLDVIQTSSSGTIAYNANVSRREFARMLVALSDRLDSVSASSNTSPFSDVPSSAADAGYIKTVASEGLLPGYLDGSFRPDSAVKLEEAACAVLRLLGYNSGTAAEQLDQAGRLGLLDGVGKTKGQVLTTNDCITLFGNALDAKTPSGTTYAASLGLAGADGKLDYGAAVTSGLTGPLLPASGIYAAVPFSLDTAEVYLNGRRVQPSAIDKNDVIYYNAGMRTVWAYRNRVAGTYTAASPSAASPSSVTVGGQTYAVTGAAAYALSDLGEFSFGDTVTLLLDRNGQAAFAIRGAVTLSAASGQAETTGVVSDITVTSYADASGKDVFSYTANVVCADGVVRQYPVSGSKAFKEGDVVKVSGQSLKKLNKTSLKGRVNSTGSKVGSTPIASDAKILDYLDGDNFAAIYPSGLGNVSLTSSNVLYHTLNSKGEVDLLILKNATGDVGSYGVVTKVEALTTTVTVPVTPGEGETPDGGDSSGSSEPSGDGESSGSGDPSGGGSSSDSDLPTQTVEETIVTGYNVTYLLNGQTRTAMLDASASARKGGASFTFKDGQLSRVSSLKTVSASRISGLKATVSGGTLTISDRVSVYVKMGDDYYPSSLATVQDNKDYKLSCCCDKDNKVRVIIAEPLS